MIINFSTDTRNSVLDITSARVIRIKESITGADLFHKSSNILEDECDRLIGTYAVVVSYSYLGGIRWYLIASVLGSHPNFYYENEAGISNLKSFPDRLYDDIVESCNCVNLCYSTSYRFCTECGVLDYRDNFDSRHSDCHSHHQEVANVMRCGECGAVLTEFEIKQNEIVRNHFTGYGYKCLCTNCRKDYNAEYRCYHGWYETPYFATDNRHEAHMGIELETQNPRGCDDDDYDECEIEDTCDDVREISDVGNINPFHPCFHFEHDGSISGFEMISEPFTLRELSKNVAFENALNKATELGYYTDYHNGAHIHLDRTFLGENQELCSVLIGWYISTFWDDFILPISDRDTYELGYCSKPCVDKNSSIFDTKKYFDDIHHRGHYIAYNTANLNTLEFRFWAGTLNMQTILARFDITQAIAIWSKNVNVRTFTRSNPWDIFKYIKRKETFDYIKAPHRYDNVSSAILSHIPNNQ